MAVAGALLDSNVVVAAVAEAHQHHAASITLLAEGDDRRFAIAAHSYAEAFSVLTRRGAGGFQWSPDMAWAALESVAAATALMGLSAAQTYDTIRSHAQDGNIGARLYDRLIGQVAVQYAIPRIVTWNVAHMRSLFPDLDVCDPAAAMGA